MDCKTKRKHDIYQAKRGEETFHDMVEKNSMFVRGKRESMTKDCRKINKCGGRKPRTALATWGCSAQKEMSYHRGNGAARLQSEEREVCQRV